ncbi:hypothetical protein NL676_029119 [Syzygium grande]|nr:hypothetical protein NL676_029119 [Syzygium grande]
MLRWFPQRRKERRCGNIRLPSRPRLGDDGSYAIPPRGTSGFDRRLDSPGSIGRAAEDSRSAMSWSASHETIWWSSFSILPCRD